MYTFLCLTAYEIRGDRPRGGLHFCRYFPLFCEDIRRAFAPALHPRRFRPARNQPREIGEERVCHQFRCLMPRCYSMQCGWLESGRIRPLYFWKQQSNHTKTAICTARISGHNSRTGFRRCDDSFQHRLIQEKRDHSNMEYSIVVGPKLPISAFNDDLAEEVAAFRK